MNLPDMKFPKHKCACNTKNNVYTTIIKQMLQKLLSVL